MPITAMKRSACLNLKGELKPEYNAIDLLGVNFLKEENGVVQCFSGERKYEVEIISRAPNESEKTFYNKITIC